MKKREKKCSGTPTQAILTPDKKEAITHRTIPNEEHVKKAKEYCEENQK